jgi:hypothetical protein
MGTGKPRISTAVGVLLIALAAELEIDPVVAPELAPVQVAVQAPVIVQGVAELEHARAEAELERDLGVAAPEHARVVAKLALVRVAAPVQNLRRDQLEARRRTRSATEAHHRDQARLLAGEDSAAVVETTRDPAATEAGVAWAAAVTAAAVAPE